MPSGPGPTKAATAGHPGDRTPGNVRLIPICPTPDPAGGRLPTLRVAGRSPRLSKSTTRVLGAGGPRACAPAEQWVPRGLESSLRCWQHTKERRGKAGAWPGTRAGVGLTGWARRIVGCSCKPLPPWARGARRGGGGGSTHRDPGNALLALEGHTDPWEGYESPVGVARTWTCRQGHARSLGSPSVSLPGAGLRLTHLNVGPAYLFHLHPGPSFPLSFVLTCSRSLSLSPSLPSLILFLLFLPPPKAP